MKLEELLGKREDLHREFKSARSLAEPETIAREVVGMLNAEGGRIWIGIEDDKEGAAAAVEPVADAEREKGRLLDYLVETLDPTPTSAEVTIDVRSLGKDDRGLLEIRVQPPPKDSPRLPVAFLKRGGRHYLRRIDARNHPMSRDEIFPG
ncbi:MAG: AlbA family DNA-binding domain-containing protein, partial [Candidatus Rokuibacteriota bacterium]